MAEDIAEIFGDTVLGHAINATTSGAATIPGLFSRAYYGSNPGAGVVDVESSLPVFRVTAANASGITQGNSLTIDSIAYTVVEVKPDVDTGTVEFRLQV